MQRATASTEVGDSRRRVRNTRRKGAAMVELALTILPTLALLMAIIDFTLPIFLHGLFNHAVRSGVRYGVTYRTQTGLSHTQSIKQVVQQNAGGFLAGNEGLAKIQVKFYSPTTFTEVTGVNANVGGNILEVSIANYRWNWVAPIWRSHGGLDVQAASADRLETLPRGVARPQP